MPHSDWCRLRRALHLNSTWISAPSLLHLFKIQEWAATLAEELKSAAGRGDPDDGSHYYEHWLAALERLVTAKGLSDRTALLARKVAWADAFRHTPHGKPIELVSRSAGNELSFNLAAVLQLPGRSRKVASDRLARRIQQLSHPELSGPTWFRPACRRKCKSGPRLPSLGARRGRSLEDRSTRQSAGRAEPGFETAARSAIRPEFAFCERIKTPKNRQKQRLLREQVNLGIQS